MKVSFPLYVIYCEDIATMYTISERQAQAWVKKKGKKFSVKRIIIRKNKV